MNETLTLALENYHGFPLSQRQKRGFFDEIGQLSRMLFGTAMNEGVKELRDRYNHLALLASAHDKAIRFNFKHIARLEQHVHDIPVKRGVIICIFVRHHYLLSYLSPVRFARWC